MVRVRFIGESNQSAAATVAGKLFSAFSAVPAFEVYEAFPFPCCLVPSKPAGICLRG